MLRPRSRTAVRRGEVAAAAFAGAPPIDAERFRAEVDALLDQSRNHAAERHARGLVDTSVLIDLERLDPGSLPLELAISAVTLAELAAGLHATEDAAIAAAGAKSEAAVRSSCSSPPPQSPQGCRSPRATPATSSPSTSSSSSRWSTSSRRPPRAARGQAPASRRRPRG